MAEKDIAEIPPKPFLPQVVDDKGHKVVGPEMEAVTHLMIQMAQLAQQARIRKSLEREHFEGGVFTQELAVTEELGHISLLRGHPYTALATAFLINAGPNDAHIAINEAHNWLVLRPLETRTIVHTKADKRIEIVYFRCNPGESASVRLEGVY